MAETPREARVGRRPCAGRPAPEPLLQPARSLVCRVATAWVAALLTWSAGARVEGATDPADLAAPFVKAFRDSEGLPQDTIHSISIDGEGFLWVGTQDGLARYDGASWEEIDLPVATRTRFVRSLVTDSRGSLWIGTQGAGVLRYQASKWQSWPGGFISAPGLRVNVIAETHYQGRWRLWVGLHDQGLASFDGDAWRRWGRDEGLASDQIWDIAAPEGVDDDRLWLATGAGLELLRLGTGTIEQPAGAPTIQLSGLLRRGSPGSEEELWAASYGSGLFRYSAGTWRRYGLEDGLPSLFLTDLEPRRGESDRFWLATDGGGVAEWTGAAFRRALLGPMFDSRAAYRLYESTAEQGAAALWVGTRNNGLLRVSEGLWGVVYPRPELHSAAVSALLLRGDRRSGEELWVGFDGRGLSRWDGDRWHHVNAASGALGNDSVRAIAETKAVGGGPAVWVGTRNGGLSRWDGHGWTRFDRAGGALPHDLVQSFLELPGRSGRSAGSRLWVGTRGGVVEFDGSSWHPPPAAFAWPEASILTMIRQPRLTATGSETVWLGTSTGVWRVRDGKLRVWGPGEGLQNPTVLALHLKRVDQRETLWIGTEAGGLALLDTVDEAPQLRTAPAIAIPRLPNSFVNAIVEDRSGRLYVSTNRGVARIDARLERGIELFTTEHGLPLNQGTVGAAQVDSRGRIWVGSVGGVAVLDPQNERRESASARLHLSLHQRGARVERLPPGARVDRNNGPISFRYVLLSFIAEPLTRYRSELIGIDPLRTDWSANRQREISGLTAGDYRFRVWGRDGYGQITGPVEVGFTVVPTWWERRSTRAMLVLLCLLVPGLMARAWHLRNLQRRQHLEAIVAARTRELASANELLVKLSYVDAVTGLGNRRRFDEILETEWKRAVRTQTSLAVIMIDVDDFKAYNDTYGHPAGDAVLRRVAEALSETLPRAGDILARYGGEEFASILPDTNLDGAAAVAERLRQSVRDLEIPHAGAARGSILTASCGVAVEVPALDAGFLRVVHRADEALYAAKDAGKDRVAVAG